MIFHQHFSCRWGVDLGAKNKDNVSLRVVGIYGNGFDSQVFLATIKKGFNGPYFLRYPALFVIIILRVCLRVYLRVYSGIFKKVCREGSWLNGN